MLSKRISHLIRLFAIISLSYFVASCGQGDGPTPVPGEPCPVDGIVSFDSEYYTEGASSATISLLDTCIANMIVVVQVDNGSEFYSKALDAWVYRHGIQLEFTRPGKPTENGHIESFNGKLRDECLNVQLFFSLGDARNKLEQWRRIYNEIRPHRSLGGMPPSEYAVVVNEKQALPTPICSIA